ncbi:MAG TPA: cupin domain-containing protein [Clostridiaceae bacterium]|nr:cupin domain-containing protein [Clostridiaceae bacterium]
MIKRESDMLNEIREQMRGGKGHVEIKHIFAKDELKGNVRLCARITINPGNSIGVHEHVNEEEIFYIISGKGLVNDNGTKAEVNPGDAIVTGYGGYHSIESIGTEPLEMMAVIITGNKQ